jgi:oxygen-independent coproporphyrinogen-3 oxidase
MRPPAGPDAAARARARTALYVHVPFCAAPCPYCHFSKEHLSGAAVERWLAALEREAALRAPAAAGVAFSSVFFGGGTPSAIAPRAFTRAWRSIRDHFTLEKGAEITLEANPETVKPGLLEAWAEAASTGCRWVSVVRAGGAPGVGAAPRREKARRGVRARARARLPPAEPRPDVRLPGPHRRDVGATLAAALALEPEHVSAYGYIVEEGTPLGDAVRGGAAQTVEPELEAQLHAQADTAFAAAGLSPYETSNWSRPGAECRHNLTYWLRRDYLAMGPSSHGLWRGERYENVRAMPDWAAALERGHDPAVARELETPASRADETVMLALRLALGLDLRDLPPDPREELEMRYGRAFADAHAGGRLERTPHGWRIPAAHRFVADDTIAWLAVRARPLPARERAA